MKYSELFTKGNGIFATVFKTEYPTEYAAIFGDTDPTKLDAYALLMYGGKTVVSSITSDNASDVVSAVIAINVQGWEKQAAAMTADYDVTNPTTETTERTETVNENETGNGTDTGADVAFNDDAFTDRTKQTQTDTKERTETTETTEKHTGIGANKNFSDVITKEMELRRINWQKNIIFALVNEITTSIYE